MAGVSSDQGDDLNVELNLVPFIDLLSSLVLFLLITAVWLQIGTVPVGVDSKGKSVASNTPSQTLFVHVKAKSFEINWTGSKLARPLPKSIPRAGTLDDRDGLIQTLKAGFGEKFPDMAAVSGDDDVSYRHIITAIDALKSTGFPKVALSTD